MSRQTKWNEETIALEASKYQSRSDLSAGNQTAYRMALKLNLLDTLYPLVKGSDWNEETITLEASKYQSRSAFFNGARAAYNAASRLNILDTVFPAADAMAKRAHFDNLVSFILHIAAPTGNNHWAYKDDPDYPWCCAAWLPMLQTVTLMELTEADLPAFWNDLNARTEWLTGFHLSRDTIFAAGEEYKARRAAMEAERIAHAIRCTQETAKRIDEEKII